MPPRIANLLLAGSLLVAQLACAPTASDSRSTVDLSRSTQEVWLLVSPANVGQLDVTVNGSRVPWRRQAVGPHGGFYNVALMLPQGTHDISIASSGVGRTVTVPVQVTASRRIYPFTLLDSAHVYLELPSAQARRVADGSVDVRIQSNGHETWYFRPGSEAQYPNSIYTLLSGGDHILDVSFVGYGNVRVNLHDLRPGERRTVRLTAPF